MQETRRLQSLLHVLFHIENVPDIYGYTSNPFNRPDTSFFVKEVYEDMDATEQEVFHALSCGKVESYLRDTWKTQ